MSDKDQVWPPAPGPQAVPTARTHCPACERKLLTQTSALCNWCGARIDDPEYQARAAANRQAVDEAERARVEAIAQEEARYGVIGRLKRLAKQNPGKGNTPQF